MEEAIKSAIRRIRNNRADYYEEDLADQIEALERALEVFGRIWEICHAPARRESALRHFQRDFDEIRALVRPFIDPERL